MSTKEREPQENASHGMEVSLGVFISAHSDPVMAGFDLSCLNTGTNTKLRERRP